MPPFTLLLGFEAEMMMILWQENKNFRTQKCSNLNQNALQ